MTRVEDRGAEVAERSFIGALRAGAVAMTDDFVRFLIGNVVWLAIVGAALLAGRLAPLGNVLVVGACVTASFGLCRMAALGVRGRPARWQHFRQGITARGWAGFGLGCLQAGLVALAVVNVTIAWRVATLPLVASAVVSGYVAIAASATVLAVWPLMLDPERQGLPLGHVVRLGLVAIAARPGRHLALVLLEVVFVAVGVQTFVAALVLPSFGFLVATAVVLPLADHLVAAPAQPARLG
jgi:hypothetical protein